MVVGTKPEWYSRNSFKYKGPFAIWRPSKIYCAPCGLKDLNLNSSPPHMTKIAQNSLSKNCHIRETFNKEFKSMSIFSPEK